jgi:DNA polymerase I
MSGRAALQLPQNPVLFGRDNTPRIVAVELVGNDIIRIFRRENGKVSSSDENFRPFLWLTEPVFLQNFDRKVEFVTLEGRGALKFLALFHSWNDFQAARRALSGDCFFALNDPETQFLLATGKTSFKAMKFAELHRLQVGLELKNGRLAAIFLSDSRGFEHEIGGAEPKILQKFAEIVRDRDPDALEGHDMFRFVLETLAARAKANKNPLKLGRDGSAPKSRSSRVQFAERTIAFPKFHVFGRHIVDTFLLAQLYDVATRELDGFELDDVAAHFGAGEGLAAVRKISEILSPSYFIQAQIFPYLYEDVFLRGNATKIDALFLREYLHQHHAVPKLNEPRAFEGGYTDIFHEGVVQNVWHCDAQSLYPSLLLAHEIKPRNDDLELFLPLLRQLREFRLKAKAAGEAALQQTFKILINSFYGYLGFAQAHFGDFDAAEKVAAKGRETLKTMLDWLRNRGAHVIEVDTDGIYFVPPQKTDAEKLEKELQEALPKGVDVEIDGQFRAMFSYKMKNYALLDNEGRLHIKGSALKSRGLEKFQREFLREMLTLALEGRAKQIPQLYETYCERIEQRKLPLEWLAKTETLQESLDVYRQKIAQSARNRSAVYELALRAGGHFAQGDRISYYITGDSKRVAAYENCRLVSEWDAKRRDENVPYYLDKLAALYKKFRPFLEEKSRR